MLNKNKKIIAWPPIKIQPISLLSLYTAKEKVISLSAPICFSHTETNDESRALQFL